MPMNDAELHDWENASDAEKVKIAQRVKARYAAAAAKQCVQNDRLLSRFTKPARRQLD